MAMSMTETGTSSLDVVSGPSRELSHAVFILADNSCDLLVLQSNTLCNRMAARCAGEALEGYQHGDRYRVGHFCLLLRILVFVGEDRLGQPFAHIPRASSSSRPGLVDRKARRDGSHERSW